MAEANMSSSDESVEFDERLRALDQDSSDNEDPDTLDCRTRREPPEPSTNNSAKQSVDDKQTGAHADVPHNTKYPLLGNLADYALGLLQHADDEIPETEYHSGVSIKKRSDNLTSHSAESDEPTENRTKKVQDIEGKFKRLKRFGEQTDDIDENRQLHEIENKSSGIQQVEETKPEDAEGKGKTNSEKSDSSDDSSCGSEPDYYDPEFGEDTFLDDDVQVSLVQSPKSSVWKDIRDETIEALDNTISRYYSIKEELKKNVPILSDLVIDSDFREKFWNLDERLGAQIAVVSEQLEKFTNEYSNIPPECGIEVISLIVDEHVDILNRSCYELTELKETCQELIQRIERQNFDLPNYIVDLISKSDFLNEAEDILSASLFVVQNIKDKLSQIK